MRVRKWLRRSQYLRDVLLQASGNTSAQFLGIVAMPLLTRIYSPSDFAALNLFSQAVAVFAIVLTLRFEYLVMIPAELRESDRLLKLIFRLGALHVMWLTPLLWILNDYWPWLRSHGAIANWLWLAPLSAWAVSLSVGLQQSVQRRGDFQSSAISEFAGRSAYVACAVAGALVLPNIAGLMVSTLANAGAKLAWLVHVGGKLPPTILEPYFAPIDKTIRRMAFSMSAANLISLFSGFVPMIFITEQYGANALGQYGLVVSTLYLPSVLLGQAIGQVYYQRISQMHGQGAIFSDLFIATSARLAMIGVPLYCVVSLLSAWAYPMVFGSDWQSAGILAGALAIAGGFSFVTSPLDRTCTVVGAWWYVPIWHGMRAVTCLGVVLTSKHLNLSLEIFVWVLTGQMSIMYLIDWISNFWFSCSKNK